MSKTEARSANRQRINEYLSSHPCVDCHEDDLVVLEFDHIDRKRFTISHAIHYGWDWKCIAEEIRHCEVRCANCHKRRHAKVRLKKPA